MTARLVHADELSVGDVVLGVDGSRMHVRLAEPAGEDVVLQFRCLPRCEAPHSHKPFRAWGTTTFNREVS